jgi:hypothetical protein
MVSVSFGTMPTKPRRAADPDVLTQRRYLRCLETGHHYGEETVSRHFQGHLVQLRVCRKCGVPEKPKIRTATR